MEDINVTTSGIIKLLLNLDVHKASGPDEISTRLLKETAEVTAAVLKLIFEKSLDTVRLQLEYASIIWSPWQKRDIEKLEKINRRTASDIISSNTTTTAESTITRRSHTNNILVPFARTDTYQHSFGPNACNIWNNLPNHIKEITSIEQFKNQINQL
ncbi:uncharacterized protein [Dysidea avara]|uniref:uncharacterized protein n=1 Tax=Dysidea avara TaxID=196820 RepID=UPI00331E575D